MGFLDDDGLVTLTSDLKRKGLNLIANAIKHTMKTIPVSSWSNNTATINILGVNSSSIVIATYHPSSKLVYTDADIYCSGQATNQLTFTCSTTPTQSVLVNILIINGSKQV